MSRHPLYAAGLGLALLGALLYFAENTALLIAAAPIALSFGWNIFNMLEAKADKRRGETGRDIDDLVVSPLRAVLVHLAGAKDEFDHTLKTMTGAPMMDRLDQLNAEIVREFVVLVNVCGLIEKYGRPEFGSGWSDLADAAQEQVSWGLKHCWKPAAGRPLMMALNQCGAGWNICIQNRSGKYADCAKKRAEQAHI